jgi:hypothetical protein
MTQMHFLTSGGRRFSGADALLELARFIWWARPLAWFGRLPGVVQALRWAYRKVAERRHRLNKACSIRKRPRPVRVFFDSP